MNQPTALTVKQMVKLALKQAELATESENSPFGAVIFYPTGEILLAASNSQVSDSDPTAHAEINAIRLAGATLKSTDLSGLCIATNAEPCPMCMAAILKSGLNFLCYGAPQELRTNPKIDAAELNSRSNTPIQIQSGVYSDHCRSQILRAREAKRSSLLRIKEC